MMQPLVDLGAPALPIDLPTPPQAPPKRLPQRLSGPLDLPKPPKTKIDDPSGHLRGSYDTEVLQDIVNAAKFHNMDPLTALAMSGQESTFGRATPDNPLHYNWDVENNHHGILDPNAARKIALDRSMERFQELTARQRAKTPDDPELIMQAYNGMGKVQGGSEVPENSPMYGGQTELIGRRDRPYGKRIAELVEMLRSQPDIQNLIKR